MSQMSCLGDHYIVDCVSQLAGMDSKAKKHCLIIDMESQNVSS